MTNPTHLFVFASTALATAAFAGSALGKRRHDELEDEPPAAPVGPADRDEDEAADDAAPAADIVPAFETFPFFLNSRASLFSLMQKYKDVGWTTDELQPAQVIPLHLPKVTSPRERVDHLSIEGKVTRLGGLTLESRDRGAVIVALEKDPVEKMDDYNKRMMRTFKPIPNSNDPLQGRHHSSEIRPRARRELKVPRINPSPNSAQTDKQHEWKNLVRGDTGWVIDIADIVECLALEQGANASAAQYLGLFAVSQIIGLSCGIDERVAKPIPAVIQNRFHKPGNLPIFD